MSNIMSVSDSMGRFVEVRVPADKTDMEIWMIESITDKCIIKPYVNVNGSMLNLKYDVTDCERFRDSFKAGRLTAGIIKKLIMGLNSAVQIMSGYLMGEENILLEPDCVFVDKYDGELRFCAYPFTDTETSGRLELLMKELLILADPRDEEAMLLSALLLRTACIGDCHIYDLMTALANTAQRESDGILKSGPDFNNEPGLNSMPRFNTAPGSGAKPGVSLLPADNYGHGLTESHNAIRGTDGIDDMLSTNTKYRDNPADGADLRRRNGNAPENRARSRRKRKKGLGDLFNKKRMRENVYEDESDLGFMHGNMPGDRLNQDPALADGLRDKNGLRSDAPAYKTGLGLKDLDDVSYDIDEILSDPGSGSMAGSANSMGNSGLYAAYANGTELGQDYLYGPGTEGTQTDINGDRIKGTGQELGKKIITRIIMSQFMMMAAMICIVFIKGMNSAVRALPIYAIMSICTVLYFVVELIASKRNIARKNEAGTA